MENTSMRGKICLISGATRGLGQAAALGLARLGATVVIIGRSRSRINNTLALLRAETGFRDLIAEFLFVRFVVRACG